MKVREIIIEQPEVVDRPPVRQREEVPLHVPGGATVVILNDPVTPAEVVVEAVVHGTGLSPDEAWRRVNRAHQGGWAPVASYASYDLAETVAERIMAHARNNTNYDHYRQFVRHQGPWPLTAEVTEAGG
jgi:ATP-dependent Clp protease adapter protein ClpS